MSAFDRLAPWWGLLVVPSAFLGLLSLDYAMVSLACRDQMGALVHLGPAAGVAIAAIGVLLSAVSVGRYRTLGAPPERRFLNAVSLAVAAGFLVASLVQWYVAAALSPCLS